MINTILVIVGVLAIVSFAVYVIVKKYPEKDFSELEARVKLWWGMVAVFSLTIFVHPSISLISLMILSFFALREFFSLIQLEKKERRVFFWAYLSVPFQFYWIWTNWYGMFIIFIPVYIFLFLPIIRITNREAKGFLQAVSSTHWGLMLMVFGLSHMAYYGLMNVEYGSNLLLYLVLLTQMSDVIQYMVSKTIGKIRIIPKVNENITLEGVLASVLVTTVAAMLIAPYLTPLPIIFGFFSGLLISFGGIVGTMNLSFVKKDMLSDGVVEAVPQKESFLSRIDSLSYTAPLFLHFLRYFFEWI